MTHETLARHAQGPTHVNATPRGPPDNVAPAVFAFPTQSAPLSGRRRPALSCSFFSSENELPYPPLPPLLLAVSEAARPRPADAVLPMAPLLLSSLLLAAALLVGFASPAEGARSVSPRASAMRIVS